MTVQLTAPAGAGQRPVTRAAAAVLALVTAAALAAGLLAAAVPLGLVATAVIGTAAVLAVAVRPLLGGVLLVVLTPLVVGIDRGAMLPLLRPSEALAGLVLCALLARALVLFWRGRPVTIRLSPLDGPLCVLVLAACVLPVLWLFARGRPVERDDLLYSLTTLKYVVVLLMIRHCVRRTKDVRTLLLLIVAVAVLVAVIGVLQALDLFGIPGLLASYWAPFDNVRALQIHRGTSTIAQSHAVADVMTFSLAVLVGLLRSTQRARPLLLVAAPALVLGLLASGTASGLIALLVGCLAVGAVTRSTGRVVLAGAAVGLPALALLRPVLQARLDARDAATGLPSGWEGRIENLQTYFLPPLQQSWNWLVGVRPAARVPAPEAWRDYVFIESGYVWLLWVGGLPLLVAFVFWSWRAARWCWGLSRHRQDALGVAATAGFVAVVTTFFLQALDPHLTLRGSADLTFMLLGLATADTAEEPERV